MNHWVKAVGIPPGEGLGGSCFCRVKSLALQTLPRPSQAWAVPLVAWAVPLVARALRGSAVAPTQEDVERCAHLFFFVPRGFKRVLSVLPCIQSSRFGALLYQRLSH